MDNVDLFRCLAKTALDQFAAEPCMRSACHAVGPELRRLSIHTQVYYSTKQQANCGYYYDYCHCSYYHSCQAEGSRGYLFLT